MLTVDSKFNRSRQSSIIKSQKEFMHSFPSSPTGLKEIHISLKRLYFFHCSGRLCWKRSKQRAGGFMCWAMNLPVISHIVGNELSFGGTTIDALFTVQLHFFLFFSHFSLTGLCWTSELV